jgi:hypothetical protein
MLPGRGMLQRARRSSEPVLISPGSWRPTATPGRRTADLPLEFGIPSRRSAKPA